MGPSLGHLKLSAAMIGPSLALTEPKLAPIIGPMNDPVFGHA
jgi:hypothetical protein